MIRTSFKSENLKANYPSFNFQFNNFKQIFNSDFFQNFLYENWNTEPNKVCKFKCGRKYKGNDWKTKVNKTVQNIR